MRRAEDVGAAEVASTRVSKTWWWWGDRAWILSEHPCSWDRVPERGLPLFLDFHSPGGRAKEQVRVGVKWEVSESRKRHVPGPSPRSGSAHALPAWSQEPGLLCRRGAGLRDAASPARSRTAKGQGLDSHLGRPACTPSEIPR